MTNYHHSTAWLDRLRATAARHHAAIAFPVAATIPLHIDLGDEIDDSRRIEAEVWCHRFSVGRWLRRVDRRENVVAFEFERVEDAVLFRLRHG